MSSVPHYQSIVFRTHPRTHNPGSDAPRNRTISKGAGTITTRCLRYHSQAAVFPSLYVPGVHFPIRILYFIQQTRAVKTTVALCSRDCLVRRQRLDSRSCSPSRGYSLLRCHVSELHAYLRSISAVWGSIISICYRSIWWIWRDGHIQNVHNGIVIAL